MESLEQGGETPPALLNRPFPTQFEVPFWDAFNRLSRSRAWTEIGASAIPISEILAFLQLYEITDLEEKDEYVMIIQALDSTFLELTKNK